MSMPIINGSSVTRCQAVTDIIESVALEQAGLAHILNAEGEKIQKSLVLSQNNDDLIKVNTSVQSTIKAVAFLETVLENKLELFDNCLCLECPTSGK